MLRKLKVAAAAAAVACFVVPIGEAHASHLSASFAFNRSADKSTDRIVLTVRGTYECGPLPQPQPPSGATFASINVVVVQAQGRDIARGESSLTPICDAVPRDFTLQILATEFPWHGGQARAIGTLFIQECDEAFNCEQVSANANVQIRISGGG